MFHPTAALPDGLRDVRPRLLLCQDLPAAPDIRPVRPVCGPGEAGRLHHNLQGLLRPGHADGQSHSLTASQSHSLTVQTFHFLSSLAGRLFPVQDRSGVLLVLLQRSL